MKLNTKFVLATFLIVLIISISSMLIFYVLAGKVIKQQQEKAILNATTNFAFNIQLELQNIDEEFNSLISKSNKISNQTLNNTSIDFLFTLDNDSIINKNEFFIKTNSFLTIRSNSFSKFFLNNPQMILRYQQFPNGKTYYFGKVIDSKFLNSISEKINAEIALISNDSPVEISNPSENQKKLLTIISAVKDLKLKNNFDLFFEEINDADFVSSIYSPKYLLFPFSKVNFLIFQSFKEGVEFRATLQMLMLIIIIAGSGVTFIIVILLTNKFRKQISLLNNVVTETRKGNLDLRVPIITKDEIGSFGDSVNKMLDEIVQKNKREKDYSDFITLINQKQTLKDLCNAALQKIISSVDVSFGAIYLNENNKLKIISNFGLTFDKSFENQSDIYLSVINKADFIELNFYENYPEVKVGITTLKIKYLLLFPIIFNKEVIAILELASEKKPNSDVKEYLKIVNDQLAIGIINATSFEKLENLVNELKILNEEFQKQNAQITNQNEELKKLHKQLKEKAEELEKQREHAVQLTKVKSDFLASMSHELKTPLISINGLSELLLKNLSIDNNVKERIKIINRNGKKLLSLINNILEFSKLESGKIELKKETFFVADLIEEIYPSIEQLSQEKNLKLNIDLPKNKNILLNTDKNKIEQVISNLVVNAIKFTETGYVNLKIEIEEDNNLKVTVEDSGIGISEKDKENIFKEFKQVDSSFSRKYSGAGLGLAICKRYLKLMNSELYLESELGKGSKFYFILNDVILDVIDDKQEYFLTTLTENKNKNILVFSDSDSAAKLFVDYLKTYSVESEYINNYKHARDKINSNKYDAIILNSLDENWKIIYDIKESKFNNETIILYSIMLEDDKIGWEPNIYDFIINKELDEKLNYIIPKIQLYKNTNKIYLITNKNYDNTLQNKNIILTNSLDEVSKNDILIIDVDSLKDETMNVCFNISNNKILKNNFLILLLPESYDQILFKNLNKKSLEIIKRAKFHPMDILKTLRDRLELNKHIENNIEISDEYENINNKKTLKLKSTILVVDDDNDALFTVGEFLKELECDTIYAHNGMECLMMLNHISPDLILLDIMMPQMDGFETIKRIRNDERFKNLPILALTAYAMLENKDVIEKNSFNDVITKPINSQLLISKIKKYLNKDEKNFSN
ncbi:MAG: ATP-binding protein [Melioribacteraceae bacterium]|nr:ATP-binding protein [Melioribacteraceae bacterium]